MAWPGPDLSNAQPSLDLRAGWNDSGIGFSLQSPQLIPRDPLPLGRAVSGSQDHSKAVWLIWLHTRNPHGIHRANRMSHCFQVQTAELRPGSASVTVTQRPVDRAGTDAPQHPSAAFQASFESGRDGDRLAVWLPAETLSGFSPEASRECGFFSAWNDPARGLQPLSLGREFPFESDPDLWHILHLQD